MVEPSTIDDVSMVVLDRDGAIDDSPSHSSQRSDSPLSDAAASSAAPRGPTAAVGGGAHQTTLRPQVIVAAPPPPIRTPLTAAAPIKTPPCPTDATRLTTAPDDGRHDTRRAARNNDNNKATAARDARKIHRGPTADAAASPSEFTTVSVNRSLYLLGSPHIGTADGRGELVSPARVTTGGSIVAAVRHAYANGDAYDGYVVLIPTTNTVADERSSPPRDELLFSPATGPLQTSGTAIADDVQEVKHGHGRYTFASGSFYDGEWSLGKMHGRGVLNELGGTGDLYDGEWRNGERHGRGSMFYGTGDVYEGTFERNAKHGAAVIMLHGSERLYEARFERDDMVWCEERLPLSDGGGGGGDCKADTASPPAATSTMMPVLQGAHPPSSPPQRAKAARRVIVDDRPRLHPTPWAGRNGDNVEHIDAADNRPSTTAAANFGGSAGWSDPDVTGRTGRDSTQQHPHGAVPSTPAMFYRSMPVHRLTRSTGDEANGDHSAMAPSDTGAEELELMPVADDDDGGDEPRLAAPTVTPAAANGVRRYATEEQVRHAREFLHDKATRRALQGASSHRLREAATGGLTELSAAAAVVRRWDAIGDFRTAWQWCPSNVVKDMFRYHAPVAAAANRAGKHST